MSTVPGTVGLPSSVMEVTAERFRALARSSPWRWSTLRFVSWRRPDGGRFDDGVRAWLQRPDRLRVEDLDGDLIQVVREEHPRSVGVLTLGRSKRTLRRTLLLPSEVTPEIGTDGLVRARPSDWEVDYDDPMFQSYTWVALLDPVELADGDDDGPATTLEDLRTVVHHGREAWEATVRATSSYTPRCSCCALLLSEESERRLTDEGGPTLRSREPDFVFSDAHRVRFDVQTGVCVHVEQLGGDRDGWCEDVMIEAVGEPMGEELFTQPSRSRFQLGR